MEERTPHDPAPRANGHAVPGLLGSGGERASGADLAGGTGPERASRWRSRPRLDVFGLRALAALGAAGVFASLVTDWLRYDYSSDGVNLSADEAQPILVQLDQFGVVAFGYLVAAIALAGCVTLALFGRVSGRSQARVLGLAMAGAALACAAALMLADESELLTFGGVTYSTGVLELQPTVQAGAWYGAAGVALLGLAVFLVPHPRELPPVGAAGPGVDPDSDSDPDGWRRPVAPRHADERPGAPLDLSVEPVEPFRFTDERREPWR